MKQQENLRQDIKCLRKMSNTQIFIILDRRAVHNLCIMSK